MFTNNALLGGGVRVRVWIREHQKKIKGTTKPLLAILNISRGQRKNQKKIKSTTIKAFVGNPGHLSICLVSWFFLLFWAKCAQAQLNPFYHPFYPDVTHVRKDTRPFPAFPYCKRWKALGTRLYIGVFNYIEWNPIVKEYNCIDIMSSAQTDLILAPKITRIQ